MENIKLLTNEEQAKLPFVVSRRSKFRQMVKLSIQNYNNTTSNSIMLQGRPGSGKTTLVEQLLEQMAEEEEISIYRRVPGHVTMKSLFQLLKEVSEPKRNSRGQLVPCVLLLDDVDCLGEEGPLELMKAAFDSKSNLPTNRKVFYFTENDGKVGFKFNGFGIIITNDDFGKKKLTVHQQALLDRVQQLSVDLEPEDMMIYTTHLVENMLNKNEEGYSNDEIKSVVELFNTDVRKWMKHDAFRKARVNFSPRLIKKFVDCQRLFGEDWKDYSIPYRQLEAACMLSEAENDLLTNSTTVATEGIKVRQPGAARIVKKHVAYTKDAKGNYINPKTGKPFSAAYQCNLRKKYA